MRRRLGPILSLAGGALLLASLYMPWLTPSCFAYPPAARADDLESLLNCYGSGESMDGWTFELGSPTALVALGLVAVAILALVRPAASRFPLLVSNLLGAYFAVAAGAVVLSSALRGPDTGIHVDYGAFVWGLALCLVLAGVATMWSGRRPSLAPFWRPASALLTGALAVLLLFPWIRIAGAPGPADLVALGVGTETGVVAAAVAVLLLAGWWSDDPAVRWERAGLSAALVVFTAGALSLPGGSLQAALELTWSAWAGLAAALAVLVLTLTRALRQGRPAVPSLFALGAGAAAGLVAASMFLPWQSTCLDAGSGIETPGCQSLDGWTIGGSARVLLAFGLVLLAIRPRRLATPAFDLAAGLALLLVTSAFALHQEGDSGPGVDVDVRPGALLGLAAGAVLVGLFAARVRPSRDDWSRARGFIAPIACCVAYLAIVVLPTWDLFSIGTRGELIFTFSWLRIAGLVLGIRLLDLWARRVEDDPPSLALVALPLSLLALAVADIVQYRDGRPTWGGGAALALTLVLAALGHIENEGGLRRVRVPEVLRVDRL